ncbi:hypothetical protein GCM10022224_056420 [Nonomuraea antimicrobica]|uniref:Uncharacterized protein n=1 Tax=Nonomuraea antimicrobica TaxID=561173 RepID=A0ABP7CE95_9ACTN
MRPPVRPARLCPQSGSKRARRGRWPRRRDRPIICGIAEHDLRSHSAGGTGKRPVNCGKEDTVPVVVRGRGTREQLVWLPECRPEGTDTTGFIDDPYASLGLCGVARRS